MPLSTNAQKLLAYLGLYQITPTEYYGRIDGSGDYPYNVNWFIGSLSDEGRARKAESPRRGVFRTALAELIAEGY